MAPPVELSPAEHVDRIDGAARELAGYLRTATDEGVSPALILPRLVLVFREVFGSMPPEVAGMVAGFAQVPAGGAGAE